MSLVVLPVVQRGAAKVQTATVEQLESLLAKARSGEITEAIVIAWHDEACPTVHMSTVDRITALGAVRVMEHAMVREWLDGRVVGE